MSIKFTNFHSKYYAHLLTLQNGSNSVEKLSQIDLNPYQKVTQSKTAPTQQKLKIQMDIRNLEKKQQRLKREMEKAEDIIFAKRSEIIDTLAQSLNPRGRIIYY